MPEKLVAEPDVSYAGENQTSTLDLMAILLAVLRRWKLIGVLTLAALGATYGVMRFVPQVYKSTVEILLYDPQRQIDTAVQKPISPFVDALSYDAMSTEINVLKSKSVMLRVAKELHLDEDPEFQTRSGFSAALKWLGLPSLTSIYGLHSQQLRMTPAEKLNQAADALQASLDIWSEAYIIFISVSAHSPAMAQRLAETIAQDYLASQREARQEALQHVADWLKGRVDDLRSRILKSEASIEAFKAQAGISDAVSGTLREQQIAALNKLILEARERVEEKHSQLEQARQVITSNGDIQSIPELTASDTLTKLRQQQSELSSRLEYLRRTLGDRHVQVIAAQAALAVVDRQISAEAGHVLGNMQNAYVIAQRQEHSLEASLQRVTTQVSPEALTKLQQLQRAADADRSLYQNYISQYNDISERRTLQDANARIISPATLPKSPSSSHRKMLYGAGVMLGLGSGVLLALGLELLRPRIRTCTEIERTFRLPVVGVIPGVGDKKGRDSSLPRILDAVVKEPYSHLNQAVHAMRISLELSHGKSKVILVTSAAPAEGKSTTAILFAASSASSGKRTILLDCDLHQQSTSGLIGNKLHPGLSDLLLGKAQISDVIIRDPVTNAYLIPAGSVVPNAADCLMSQRMRALIAQLRDAFDYVVIDAPPLLPIVDSLVLAPLADKVLVIVAWDQTARASISEAVRLLRPESHRVAGVVLNKVDLSKMPDYGYGRYYYRPPAST